MTVAATKKTRGWVTRHALLLTSEGAVDLLWPSGGPATAAARRGCLAMACGGSDMFATVTVERHTEHPGAPSPGWVVALEGQWQLTSGALALSNPDGMLEWLPDLGLAVGSWHVRALNAGAGAAGDLEDQDIANQAAGIEPDESLAGPERWTVQLWP